jgi:cytochrome oxidase assembly protein ShyY1
VRSLRFLASRRWILFAVTVGLLAYLAWVLGEWQFHRLEERKAANAITARNEQAAPVAVETVLAPGRPVAADDEWRLVTATGVYLPEETVIVRYRTHKSTSGVEVVVPLGLPDGTAVLVDRGWTMTENVGTVSADEVPPPPEGEVRVVGWVRADATGDSTAVTDRSTRAVSSAAIGEALDRSLLGGFVNVKSEDPEPAEALIPVTQPDLGNGPHFFYGLQWWFFGVLAIGGFCYLALDEWRKQRRPAVTKEKSDSSTR